MRMYKLVGKKAVETDDITDLGRTFEGENNVVQQTYLPFYKVSTIFLAIDHQFREGGPPMIFETMVFGGSHEGEQWRYSTWEEAEAGHYRIVNQLRKELAMKTFMWLMLIFFLTFVVFA